MITSVKYKIRIFFKISFSIIRDIKWTLNFITKILR